MDKKVKSY